MEKYLLMVEIDNLKDKVKNHNLFHFHLRKLQQWKILHGFA